VVIGSPQPRGEGRADPDLGGSLKEKGRIVRMRPRVLSKVNSSQKSMIAFICSV